MATHWSASGIKSAGRTAADLHVIETTALHVAAGQWNGARVAELPAGIRPTAMFCANDLLALGALQEMTVRRVRVPGSIAIVGYDDIDGSNYQHRQVIFEPELVVRESSSKATRAAEVVL